MLFMNKKTICFSSALGLCLGATLAVSGEVVPYAGSRFADVWAQVKSDPYTRGYPEYAVTKKTLGEKASYFKAAAARTLNDEHDILPWFQKLIRPHGICLKGEWKIDNAPAEYTGAFRNGTRALIIARASVGMTETKVGEYRAFGLAGKIFPTSDERDARAYPTANFFTIDDNAGTLAEHLTDVAMTNQPVLTPHFSLLKKLPLLAAIKSAQKKADSHEGVRQLYPISRLGLDDIAQARGPSFILIQGATQPDRSFADFRDELRVENYSKGLTFKILVADDRKGPWTQIGQIEVNESVASDSCDHRLHFSHPKWL